MFKLILFAVLGFAFWGYTAHYAAWITIMHYVAYLNHALGH